MSLLIPMGGGLLLGTPRADGPSFGLLDDGSGLGTADWDSVSRTNRRESYRSEVI